MTSHKTISPISFISFLSLLFSACTAQPVVTTQVFQPPQLTISALTAAPATATAVAKGTPTPVIRAVTESPKVKSLTVCMPYEPDTLYEYGKSGRDGLLAQAAVLEAVRDGPIDHRNFDYQPILLEKLPDLKDGDAAIAAVTVRDGEDLVDSSGGLVKLAKDVKYFDADGIERVYDGKAKSVRAMQMTVTFKLKQGLKWEDGQPLTADDIAFAWQLAKSPDSPTANHFLTNRMKDPVVVVDSRTIRWTYMPGYKDSLYYARFPAPYPKHLYGKLTPAQVANDPAANRKPLSFGAFKIDEWVPGKQITLSKNPNYFRALEGLPKLDTLIYRFVPDVDQMVSELLSGKCDVGIGLRSGTTDSIFDSKIEMLLQAKTQGTLAPQFATGTTIEHLDFNISPVENYVGLVGEGLFQNVKIRQAFAYCIDRKSIADTLMYGRSEVPPVYVSSAHPFFDPNGVATYPFNPDQGRTLLKEAGWIDSNKDGVLDKQGRSLTLKYVYGPTGNKLRQAIAQKLKTQLKDNCGVQLDSKELDRGDLYGGFPDGVLFGRRFDLGQFAWVADAEPPCNLYTTREWTGAADGSTDKYKVAGGYPQGGNNVGYLSSAFEEACLKAVNALDLTEKKKFHQQAMRIFAQDLPSIMLFVKVKVAVARPNVNGMSLDATHESELWNLEQFEVK